MSIAVLFSDNWDAVGGAADGDRGESADREDLSNGCSGFGDGSQPGVVVAPAGRHRSPSRRPPVGEPHCSSSAQTAARSVPGGDHPGVPGSSSEEVSGAGFGVRVGVVTVQGDVEAGADNRRAGRADALTSPGRRAESGRPLVQLVRRNGRRYGAPFPPFSDSRTTRLAASTTRRLKRRLPWSDSANSIRARSTFLQRSRFRRVSRSLASSASNSGARERFLPCVFSSRLDIVCVILRALPRARRPAPLATDDRKRWRNGAPDPVAVPRTRRASAPSRYRGLRWAPGATAKGQAWPGAGCVRASLPGGRQPSAVAARRIRAQASASERASWWFRGMSRWAQTSDRVVG